MTKRTATLMTLLLIGLATLTHAQQRHLPPSLERELQLRKGGASRVMVFSDTLKAKSRIAESLRDTSLRELDSTMVTDSAIVVTDSAVSVSHKGWLDAHIAEMPEYRITENGPRLVFPLSSIIDTRRRTLPFDSTLPLKMGTVDRERIIVNEALPLTRPIARETPPWLLFSAGLGSISLPMLEFTVFPFNTQAVNTAAQVLLQNNTANASALRSMMNAKFSADLFFPLKNQRADALIPQLGLNLEYLERSRYMRTAVDTNSYSVSSTSLGALLRVGELQALRLDASARADFFSDDAPEPLHESGAALNFKLSHEKRPYLVEFDVNYQTASKIDITPFTAPYHHASIGATIGFLTADNFKVGGGIAFAASDDARISRSGLLPHAFLKWQQSPFFLLSASASRSYKLVTLNDLANTNLFYSALLAENLFSYSNDPRGTVLEPLRLTLSTEYTVSIVERFGVEVRYIMTEDEPVFELLTDTAIGNSPTGASAFAVIPRDTRKLEAEAKATLLLFKGDELNASVMFASSTITNEERSIPFAPTMNAAVTYTMKGTLPVLTPLIELTHLARPDKSISLVSGEVSYKISSNLGLFARVENIFNAAGDFWTGYNEHPRNIMAGVRGRF